VTWRHVEHAVARREESLERDSGGKGWGAGSLGKGEFDRDLPDADGGDENIVGVVRYQRFGALAQSLGIRQRPDCDLRIQK
jgi:hypothetical protein